MKRKQYSTVRDEEHVISRANGRQSVEQIVLDSPAAKVLAGTVLGKRTAGGKYTPLDLGAGDGSQVPAAVLAPTVYPTDPVADVRTGADVRGAEMNGHKLVWPAGISAAQKAAAEATLADAGVIVRY